MGRKRLYVLNVRDKENWGYVWSKVMQCPEMMKTNTVMDLDYSNRIRKHSEEMEGSPTAFLYNIKIATLSFEKTMISFFILLCSVPSCAFQPH